MRKVIVFLSLLLATLPSLFAAVTVDYASGPVSVTQNRAWVKAVKGMELGVEDRIRTDDGGRAVLLVDGASRIWIKEKGELAVASLEKGSLFDLAAGTIRAKVKLKPGQAFKVRTPVFVASVRGTDFIVAYEGLLAVLEGVVEFSDIRLDRTYPVESGSFSRVQPGDGSIGQGQEGTGGPRVMTDEQRDDFVGGWQDFGQAAPGAASIPGGEQQGLRTDTDRGAQLAALRQEMREFVSGPGGVQESMRQARAMNEELRESDMSAGRTLRDVHGNVVRVEQHFLRPDDQTFKLLNISQRNDYRYSDPLRNNWAYNGPAGARLDVMDVTVRMNTPMPDQMSAWPDFVSSRGDDLHPDRVEVLMSNQTDELRSVGDWKLAGDLDEKGEVLREDQLVFHSFVNGWEFDTAYEAGQDPDALFPHGTDVNGSGTGDLWAWSSSPQLKVFRIENGVREEKFVRLFTEGYVINNSGAIQNVRDYTRGNVFGVFDQAAGEQVVFCRNLDGSDFFVRGNLDLIVLPDVLVSAALDMADQLDKFGGSDGNGGN